MREPQIPQKENNLDDSQNNEEETGKKWFKG